MKKKLEIVLIKANHVPIQGRELYWLFSRTQLEILFKELEVFSAPPAVNTARYQEVMLPVISLENYYGLKGENDQASVRYLVVRAAADQKELVKLIIQTSQPLKIDTLETGVASYKTVAFPQNSADVLGTYLLGNDKIGVFPNFVKIKKSFL